MSKTTDDNEPSGVQPHAGISWKAKYEYMNTLWLKQKEQITTLQALEQKIYTEIQSLQAELAKKNTEIASLVAEVALAKVEERTKAEELTVIKNTKTEASISKQWITCFTILLILLVLFLMMSMFSQKNTLLLLTMGETYLLPPP